MLISGVRNLQIICEDFMEIVVQSFRISVNFQEIY